MRRAVGLLASMVMAGVLVQPIGAEAADPTVTLDIRHPSGARGNVIAPGSAVAVYLIPFDPPRSFTPRKVARGMSDTQGRFTFSLSMDAAARTEAAKSSSGEVNVLIRALSGSRTWSGDLELALPVFSNLRLTFHLDSPMPAAGLEDISDERLLAAGLIIEDTPPDGFSCADYQPGENPPPLDASSDGSPPWDPYAACEEEGWIEGSSRGIVTRYAKFINLHVSRAMSGSVFWAQGRGSKTQEGYRICYPLKGGCDAFRAGMMRIEAKRRGTDVTLRRRGRYNRTWKFEYHMKRYRRCVEWEWVDPQNWGRCKKMKRYFVPYEWTWGSHDKKVLKGPSPKMRRKFRIRLPRGVTIRTQEHVNRRFEKGMSFFGVSLDSQANYSEITRLSWTGRRGCNRRFLYGRRSLPKNAREIFAKSFGCG